MNIKVHTNTKSFMAFMYEMAYIGPKEYFSSTTLFFRGEAEFEGIDESLVFVGWLFNLLLHRET